MIAKPIFQNSEGKTVDQSNYLAITLVILAGIISALHVGKASIAIPQMYEQYHWSLSTLSWIMSVFPFIGVIGGMAAGILVKQWGDKRLLCLGLAVLAGASFLGAMTTSFTFLIATRIVEGLGFLLIVVSAPSILNRLATPQQYNMVFGFWSMFMGIGIAISIFLGPLLNNWQSLWLINAGLTFLILIFIFLKVPHLEKTVSILAQPTNIKDDILRVLKTRNPSLLAIAFAAYNIQFFSVLTFLPLFLVNRTGMSVAQAGFVCGAVVISNITGNLTSSFLLNRGVKAKTIIIFASAAIGILGIGIFLPFTPELLAIILCFLFSMVSGLIPATIVSSAPRSSPDISLVSLCIGAVMQGNYLGQVIGPLAIGLAISFAGWTAAVIPVGIAALIGVLAGSLLNFENKKLGT